MAEIMTMMTAAEMMTMTAAVTIQKVKDHPTAVVSWQEAQNQKLLHRPQHQRQRQLRHQLRLRLLHRQKLRQVWADMEYIQKKTDYCIMCKIMLYLPLYKLKWVSMQRVEGTKKLQLWQNGD
jgi:hypothetical protein